MTIRRGVTWGMAGRLAEGRPTFGSDADLGAFVNAARAAGEALGEVGLSGGDLARTLGITGGHREASVRLGVDVIRAELDGHAGQYFVAHLLAHRRGWSGQAAVAMNAEWWGALKLGPRAHPGDGLVDVTSGTLNLRDRARARGRARSGDHLPHPALTVTRAGRASLEFRRPTGVWLDGRRVGNARHIALTVEPDALIVVV